ncbi:MAG: hypothetical protein WCZ26_06480 [Methanothrix soehngenii]|jgi:hypothetical protein
MRRYEGKFDRGDMDEEMCELYICLNYIEAACPCAPRSLPTAGLLRAMMSRSPYFYQKLFIIKLKVGCMKTKSGAGKSKLYPEVDDEAKGIWLCSRQNIVFELVMMLSK